MRKVAGRKGVKGKDQFATLGDVGAAWDGATKYSDEVGKAVYDRWIKPLELRVARLERPWWRFW